MQLREALKDPAKRHLAIEEFKIYLLMSLYLWVAIGSFTIFRRMVLAETGFVYMHHGIAVVQALVIGKVVMVGRLFGFARRFDDSPLVWPVLYKSAMFALLVAGFGILEQLVPALAHGKGVAGMQAAFEAIDLPEVGIRIVLCTVILAPFFAFCEVGRVLGADRLKAMFLGRTAATT